MGKSIRIINELLVDLFNDILVIEQNAIKDGDFNDISITEIHTIEAIGMYSSKTMGEVAQALDITVGTLTIAINNLLKKGYVHRERSEIDRRVVLIELTRRGKIVYRIHEKFHSDMIRETIAGLTEDEEQVLVHSLEKVSKFFKLKYFSNEELKAKNNASVKKLLRE
ncbi:MarR family transcriptional regulator [Clostridium sp.]|uniref:MarR family winged helix-turn-helix transcriptional regulator n=1 Tax=Clostridium sp. TaxID=1506 RepID=UPI0032165B64